MGGYVGFSPRMVEVIAPKVGITVVSIYTFNHRCKVLAAVNYEVWIQVPNVTVPSDMVPMSMCDEGGRDVWKFRMMGE